MAEEKKKSGKEVCGEIAVIQMKHTERIAFLTLLLGTIVAVIFAVSTLYANLYPISAWIMIDAIFFLVALVFALIYYFKKVDKMKDEIKEKVKGQVELLYLIIAIVIILIIISYLKQIGVI